MTHLLSRIYSILLSISFIAGLHADYLLLEHRADGSLAPITARTPHSVELFRVILKYQFPANTNPVTGITPVERELLDANEHAFIQYKINEINPAVDVIFVPSVLYELFIITRFLHETPRDAAMRHVAAFIACELTWTDGRSDTPTHAAPEETERICTEIHTLISQQPAEARLTDIESELISVIRCFFTSHLTKQEPLSLAYNPIPLLLAPPFTSPLGNLDPIFSKYSEDVLPRIDEIHTMDDLYVAIAHTAETALPVYQSSNELLGNWLHSQSLLTTELNRGGNRQLSVASAQRALHSLACTTASLLHRPHFFDRFYYHISLPRQLAGHLGTPLTPARATCTSRSPIRRGMGRIIKDSLHIEYEAHLQGQAVLYRGTNGITLQERSYLELPLYFGRLTGNILFQRVSFGNSLFSGIFNDDGANAFDYIGHRSIGYALLIDKKQYAADFGRNTHIIIIPPYPSLVTLLWGQGESFHPVTRSWKEQRLERCGGGLMDIASKKELVRWSDSALTQEEYIAKFAQLFGSRDTVVFLKSHVDQTRVKHHDPGLEDKLLENTRSLTFETLAPYLDSSKAHNTRG